MTNRRDVREVLKAYVEGADSPDMKTYGESHLQNHDRSLWVVRHVSGLVQGRGKRILDIGCGYGFQALEAALEEESDVVGLEMRQIMVDAVNRRVAALSTRVGPVKVRALKGDICEEATVKALGTEPFDAAVCYQAIEHIWDLESCFRSIFRVLKPGGRLVCIDDNNSRNPRALADNSEMWAKRDRSREFVESLKTQRPVEDRDSRPYADMREEIVRSANPRLTEPQVAALVDATAGLLQPEIARHARDFREGNTLPTRAEYSWCRNPVTGEYCERLLDPYEVRSIMEAAGFDASLRHIFRRWPLSLLNGTRLRSIHNLLWRLRPIFIVMGEKPSGSTS